MDIGQLSVVKIAAGSAEDLLGLRPTVFVGADGVVVIGDGMFWNHRRDIVALVNAARLPAIYPEREYVEDGGLMAYGANAPDNFHRAADYVDRILKGTKSSDLPIHSRSSSISSSTSRRRRTSVSRSRHRSSPASARSSNDKA
jgi:ABC-type uncharacterized transport system substrate-binding protein